MLRDFMITIMQNATTYYECVKRTVNNVNKNCDSMNMQINYIATYR